MMFGRGGRQGFSASVDRQGRAGLLSRSIATLLAGLVLLPVLVDPARAERRRPGTDAPGQFDYYLLSLSIAPSFCALSPANAGKRECRELTPEAVRETPLTLHGLWPNRARVSTNRQPRDCDGPPYAIAVSTEAQLRRFMPGGPGLARYEWRKHGTCSGLDPDRYYAMAAELTQRANQALGPSIIRQGGTLRIADLLQSVTDPALAAAIVVDCQVPRGGGDALVSEIRIAFSADFRPIPASSVGLGQNSGCPAGAGRIPPR